MATSRPFAYNPIPPGSEISGTTQFVNLAIGVLNEQYDEDYGGVKWWEGPDEDLGYIICQPMSGNTQPTPISGLTASVGFYRTTAFTDSAFLNLCNALPARKNQVKFQTTNDAIVWLTANGYWTNYIAPTPTPTPTVTPTPTLPCDCVEYVNVEVTSAGTINYLDCSGGAQFQNVSIGPEVIGVATCIDKNTLGGTAVFTIDSYGPCCTVVTPTPTPTPTSTPTGGSIATFDGDFILCVQAGATLDFRAQDGSATSGHFTTTAYITAGNCSGPVNVTGTLTSAQGPFKISVPAITSPSTNTAVIVAQAIGATNATVTTAVESGVLKIIITPNSYPSTVTLSGTLTVTFP